jgi:type IV pilus assembly protein PilB
MRISDVMVENLLKATGKFSDDQLQQLRELEKTEKKPLQDIVTGNGILSEEYLTKLYAAEIGVSYAEFNPRTLDRDVQKLIPEHIGRQYKAVVFNIDDDGNRLVALEDPGDIQAINFLRKQLGINIRPHIASTSDIQAALDQYRGNISSELTTVSGSVAVPEDGENDSSESDVAHDPRVAQTINLIIEYAVKAGASDIHIEPREAYVITRFRIDGVLREANKMPLRMLSSLVNRIKILSNLKINEHHAPQDGRFKAAVAGSNYSLRVSILPIIGGENVVMHIQNESRKPATLEELGFWGTGLRILQQAIMQPHGMVLVTGPTRSGKSTTLFSILSMINNPSVNISTVEDPIEYRVFGANQLQVNPLAGITFPNGLRALLRQDPNIIMVGELRDNETAQLAVEATQAGHLVFSTFQTHNAASCLNRLLDMKIEPFLIGSAVRAVVGQRLVRRMCLDCREQYMPDATTLKHLTTAFSLNKAGVMKNVHELEKQAMADGIGKTGTKVKLTDELASSEHAVKHLWKANSDGCENCNYTGYRGRLGIYEVLGNTSSIQRVVVSDGMSEHIQKAATEDGMVTMQLDGLIKALRGQTTIEEVLRATSAT